MLEKWRRDPKGGVGMGMGKWPQNYIEGGWRREKEKRGRRVFMVFSRSLLETLNL